MSTTQKQRDFYCDPMGDKNVTAVDGILPAYAAKLSQGGADKAYHLLGQYLVHNKDERSFTESLKNAGVPSDHAMRAYNCLNEWANCYI